MLRGFETLLFLLGLARTFMDTYALIGQYSMSFAITNVVSYRLR
jgi:hypothetical protein